jgi:hypothetical protein
MNNPLKAVMRPLGTALALCLLLGVAARTEDTPVSTNTNTAGATGPTAAAEDPGEAAAGTNQPVILEKIPPTTPTNLKLSPAAQEIVKMAQAGVSEPVLVAFINKTEKQFNLTADDILYLNDLGVSQGVIAQMLNHDGADEALADKVLEKERPNTTENPTTAAAATQTAPPPQVAQAPQPAPAIEVSTNYTPNTPSPLVAQSAAVQQPQVVVQQQPPVIVEQQPPVVIEQAPETVVYESPAVTYSYFYPTLAPYGSWVLVSGYGWCWQPTISITHEGWRPYCHGGRWLYSDCGWYWDSDYSWGWAPFHYGRWFCPPGHSWVWAPDYTWGPSWVTWRSHNDYCGWAPLPPRAVFHEGVGFSYYDRHVGVNFSFGLGHDYYTFVPMRHFADRRIAEHVVPTRQTINIYQNSTVINNYSRGRGNTVINEGISKDRVAAATHTEIHRVSVRDMSGTGNTTTIRPERVTRQGGEPVVYRPKPPPPQMEKRLEAVRTAQEVHGGARPVSSTPGRPIPSRNAVTASSTGPSTTTTARPSYSPRAAENNENLGAIRANENAREQVANRSAQFPALGKPAPLQPEAPPAVVTPTRTRARQESRITTSSPAAVGSATTSARPSSVPATTPQTVTRSEPSARSATSNPTAQPTTRAQTRVTQPSAPTTRGSQEIVGSRPTYQSQTTRIPSQSTTPSPALNNRSFGAAQPSNPRLAENEAATPYRPEPAAPRSNPVPAPSVTTRNNPPVVNNPAPQVRTPAYSNPQTPTYTAPATRREEPPPRSTINSTPSYQPRSTTPLPPISAPARQSPAIQAPIRSNPSYSSGSSSVQSIPSSRPSAQPSAPSAAPQHSDRGSGRGRTEINH